MSRSKIPPIVIPEEITVNGTTYNIKQLLQTRRNGIIVNLQTGKEIKATAFIRSRDNKPYDNTYRGVIPKFTVEQRRQLLSMTWEQIQEQYQLNARQAKNLLANSARVVESHDIKQQLLEQNVKKTDKMG